MVRRSADEWRVLVQAWRASQLPCRVFAARRQVNPHTLTWWAWHLGIRAGEVAEAPAFVEVLVAEAPAPAALVVEVGPVRVHVPHGFDAGEVRRLVAALC